MRGQIRDGTLVALACVLSAFGVAMLYSAGQIEGTTVIEGIWKQQLAWLVIGVGAAYFVSRAPGRLVEWGAIPAYAVAVLLLLALLIPGVGTGAGTAKSAQSWLTIGGTRLGQPSELAKIAVVLMLAKVLAPRREAPKSLFELWKPILIVGIPWLLIMKQPDLGTGMVLVGIFFAMLFWSGASWQLLVFAASPAISLILAFSTGLWGAWFLLLLALVVRYRPYVVESVAIVLVNVVMGVVAPMIWDKMQPHQRERLLVFLDPQSDARAAGYQLLQSQVAIGSGGLFGKGYTMGTQKRLAFLPTRETDFIFPVVAEELGFIGVTIALALLCVFLLRVVRIATRALDPFSALVAFGLAAAWLVHIVVNVGMTIGLIPITGIPLPFFSYGGSFMLTCWIGIGLLVRISAGGRGRADTLAI